MAQRDSIRADVSEKRSRGATLAASVLMILSVFAGASDGMATGDTAYHRSVEALEKIARIESGFKLEAWVNDGNESSIRLGTTMQYRFRSAKASRLLVIHIDSAGKASVLFPNGLGTENWLEPNTILGLALQAQLPTGREFVLAVATPKSIGASDLGISSGGKSLAILIPDDVPAVAHRIEKLIRSLPAADRAVASFKQSITQYTRGDIVDTFGPTPRGTSPVTLDVQLHFDSAQHVLLEAARIELDVFADGIRDPRVRKKSFVVGGHTDDVGEPEENMQLSQRRAEAVVRYLTGQKNIDPARLRVRAYGESRPTDKNSTPEARRLNRRVEFELDRNR